MSDFEASTSFISKAPKSAIRELMKKESTSTIWSQGAVKGYACAVKSMVEARLTMSQIAEILGETPEMIEDLSRL